MEQMDQTTQDEMLGALDKKMGYAPLPERAAKAERSRSRSRKRRRRSRSPNRRRRRRRRRYKTFFFFFLKCAIIPQNFPATRLSI